MRWFAASVSGAVAGLVRRLWLLSSILLIPAVLMASVCLSGCIRLSPNAEVVDCALAFLDAIASGDLTAIAELTVNRPVGWEIAVGNLHGATVIGVQRSGDRAQVRVRLEHGTEGSAERSKEELTGRAAEESIDEFLDEAGEAGPTELDGQPLREELVWIVDLQRVNGTWLVDLTRTLGLG
jgi:hypothetical protein